MENKNDKMGKVVKWAVSLIVTVGLVAVAAMTCPGVSQHKRVVKETIKKEIKREFDMQKEEGGLILNWMIEGASTLERWFVSTAVERDLIVDDFWLFSVGSMTDSNGIHMVSIGVFDHVFVFPMYVRQLVHNLQQQGN